MAKNWSATSPMNWHEKILFGLLYAYVWIISIQPFWLLYVYSDCLCFLVHHIVGYRKNIVRKNLRNSFPEKSDEEQRKIEADFYHYFCDYIFETIKLATISEESIKKHMVFHNMEEVHEACREGRGVALYIGHYCNWEWITSIGLHLLPDTGKGQIYHVLESKVFDRLMLRLRSRMHTQNIPMSESLRQLIRWKQQGLAPVVGFISDQSPILYNIPLWTNFLHQHTAFISGTERLAKKLNMRCVYLDVRRTKRGYYDVDCVTIADRPTDMKDVSITELYVRSMEKTIRRQPPYWLWTHNRWKRKPEEYKNAQKKMNAEGNHNS